MNWTETGIAAALARQTFNRQHLVVVPNCNWTGNECDLLVVTGNLRIIDVEIKISRADLKADAKKTKWWHTYTKNPAGPNGEVMGYEHHEPRHNTWPRKVWKHYYCMPREIWTPDLLPALGSPASGVLLLTEQKAMGTRPAMIVVSCEKRATPCRTAEAISPADAIDIARLASLRMWDAYAKVDRAIEDCKRTREMMSCAVNA